MVDESALPSMLQPIERPSVVTLVEERIRAAIHFGYFLPGDKLPPERDIAEILGVSRVTVSQAIKALRERGYLVSKRGPAGAATVTPLTKPTRRMQAQLASNRRQFEQLMEFRTHNEVLAAELAAQRRTDEDLQRLRSAVEGLASCKSAPTFRRYDADFHLAVAKAAGNAYLEQVVQLARDHMFLIIGHFDDIILSTTLEGHTAVLKAIEAKDAAAAAKAMGNHLTQSKHEFDSDFQLDD